MSKAYRTIVPNGYGGGTTYRDHIVNPTNRDNAYAVAARIPGAYVQVSPNGVTGWENDAPAAPAAPQRETLATALHDGHTVTVTRDEPLSVGNGMPYTVVRVNGAYVGEVIGSRREDDGTLTARLRVVNGYDRLTLTGNGADFTAALTMRAPEIVAAYRRLYPLAR